jgi:ParB family chromosome partitioning protein
MSDRKTQPEAVELLPVERIRASRYQPRRRFDEERLEELAASIRELGIIQPLVVRPAGSDYELIAGERRLRAAQRAGLSAVPAIVRHYSDEQVLEAALIENLQREEITAVEAARGYRRLIEEFGYTQAEVALRTGKSRVAVTNTLRLLQLPEPLLELLESSALTEGHARALLGLPYPSLQQETADWVVRSGASVRETERRVRTLAASPPRPGSPDGDAEATATDPHVAAIEERLRRHFGTKATVEYLRGRGTINLEFYNAGDLERILELLLEGR